ncbi:hypothetical protein GCM10010289_83760 [Streptomyces violascens]|uniref:Uncharacterized protein n=1 Tax=Streptomyces violascens TaxID=67381 RepID=A0ABQ3QSI0_9ACTN|nr:hypothetical protein GCM10010289_83760 [Streptomyces violascens]GHI40189.1 hypothetical protein Sviol_45970 [Streptomyces violascens]
MACFTFASLRERGSAHVEPAGWVLYAAAWGTQRRAASGARRVEAPSAGHCDEGTIRTPYCHHREQPERYQQFNRDHPRIRAPGERAFAQLEVLATATTSPMFHPPHRQAVHAIHMLMTRSYSR